MNEKNLCDQIAALRRSAGMTQEQLAQRLGVSYQAVSKWENNQSCPDIMLLPTLADIFGVSLDRLFGRPGPEPSEQPEASKPSAPAGSLPWPNDDGIYAVLYQGHRLMGTPSLFVGEHLDVCLRYEGDAVNVSSTFDVSCGDVAGDAHAGCDVHCGDVGGSIRAGCDVNCGDVGGNVHAYGNINYGSAGDVNRGDAGDKIHVHGSAGSSGSHVKGCHLPPVLDPEDDPEELAEEMEELRQEILATKDAALSAATELRNTIFGSVLRKRNRNKSASPEQDENSERGEQGEA